MFQRIASELDTDMRAILISTLAILAIGCERANNSAQQASQTADKPVSFRLPVSTNDVMVALVNDAANPIWMAAWKEPQTEEQWRVLERRAFQLQLAGALVEHPGTGALDEKWAAKPAWIRWSRQLQDTGADAVAAAQNRDSTAISNIGYQLVEVCEGCHIDFKLPHPTGGKYGELAPTPSDR